MAARISSASTLRLFAFGASNQTCTGVVGERRWTRVTFTDLCTAIPSSPNLAAIFSPTNGSKRLSSRSPRLSTVTSLAPSEWKACASSHATGPPPSTTSLGGIRSARVASRLVQGEASDKPGMGGNIGAVPVQMATAWRAVSRVTEASAPTTSTTRSPARRPCPRSSSTLAFLSHSTWPSSCHELVKRVRRLRTADGSRSPVTACLAPSTRRAVSRAAELRSNALLGMQAA